MHRLRYERWPGTQEIGQPCFRASLEGRRRRITLAAAALVTVPLVASAALPAGHPSADRRQDNTKAARQAVIGGQARNVILLIGDGMGDSEITIARNYAVGAAGRLAMDTLPMTGAYTTYSVEKDDPSCRTTWPTRRRPGQPGPPVTRPTTARSR